MSSSKIGTWSSTSLVLGNMIGSGIFLLPASLALYGGISIIGWILSAMGALVLAKVFASLSKMIPKTGGPYTYSQSGLGDFAGFLVAWGYWISIWCSNAAITVAMVGYLGVFFPVLDQEPIMSVMTGITIIWLLTWVNTRGVKEASYVQLVTTILKVIPLLLISIVGLLFMNMDHFIPFNLSGEISIVAIVKTTTLTLFAFLGVECATIPADDIDNPSVTIPKATMYGTWLAIVVYIIGSVSVMGIIPPGELVNSSAPFADAANKIFGPWAEYLVAIGAIISTFGALNGWMLMQGQIPFAAAKDGLFPSIFSRLNNRHVPTAGIVISSVLVTLLMITNYTKGLNKAFEFMILLSTLTVLVPYLFSSAAYIILSKSDNASGRNKVLLLGMGAFLFSLFAVIGSGQEVVFWGFVLLMAGIPFYIWIKKNE
jgi:APA family basic amino acid/polyamine antiporter